MAHWKLNNATTTDSSGNGNTLTDNGADSTTGLYGVSNTAYDFEISQKDNMSIASGDQTNLDITGDFSIAINLEDQVLVTGDGYEDFNFLSRDFKI